jgi:hypothetical protein
LGSWSSSGDGHGPLVGGNLGVTRGEEVLREGEGGGGLAELVILRGWGGAVEDGHLAGHVGDLLLEDHVLLFHVRQSHLEIRRATFDVHLLLLQLLDLGPLALPR